VDDPSHGDFRWLCLDAADTPHRTNPALAMAERLVCLDVSRQRSDYCRPAFAEPMAGMDMLYRCEPTFFNSSRVGTSFLASANSNDGEIAGRNELWRSFRPTPSHGSAGFVWTVHHSVWRCNFSLRYNENVALKGTGLGIRYPFILL